MRTSAAQPLKQPSKPKPTISELDVTALIDAVRSVLSPDLLKPQYRDHPDNPMYGHCYVASEALFHLLGGRASNWRPYRGRDESGVMHWWLQMTASPGGLLDVTADQYYSVGKTPPYAVGRMGTFLTLEPSKRARTVIDRVADAALS
jgi:hypothetical protein